MYHLLRNMGSSIFISLSVFAAVRMSKISYAELTEFITPFNEVLRQPVYNNALDLSTVEGLLGVSGEIVRQAEMLGFISAFGLYMVASLGVLPIVMLVRVRKPGD